MSRDCKLIFIGDSKKRSYLGSGIDDKKDYQINCQVNDEIMVTEEKKIEMLRDHGNWFKEPGEQNKPDQLREKPTFPTDNSGASWESPSKPPETEPEIEPDLESKTNAELRELAGTDDKRLSKKKLIKLIESKK